MKNFEAILEYFTEANDLNHCNGEYYEEKERRI